MTFDQELAILINKYNRESSSDTPDWLLANYIVNCLANFDAAVRTRERWFGREKFHDERFYDEVLWSLLKKIREKIPDKSIGFKYIDRQNVEITCNNKVRNIILPDYDFEKIIEYLK